MEPTIPSVEEQEVLVTEAEADLKKLVNQHFPKDAEGSKPFRLMVKKLLPQLRNTPASANTKYHGAWAGGLLVHTVHVIKAALAVARVFKTDIENLPAFEKSLAKASEFERSLVKVCFLHDIGKVGNLSTSYYLEQDNDWRATNLGEMFVIEKDTNKLPYLPIPVRGLWIAQQFGVDLDEDEYQAVIASDGPATAHGKQVIATFLEEPLTMVVHFADIWVSQVRGI